MLAHNFCLTRPNRNQGCRSVEATGRQIRLTYNSATLCQDEVHPRDVNSDLYGMSRHSTAHLYSVLVLEGFDAVRNCSHCRQGTDANCTA